MSDAGESVGMRAAGGFALPGRAPDGTFTERGNKRTLVAVSLGRRTLPALFSVFSHHDVREEPGGGSGEPVSGPGRV